MNINLSTITGKLVNNILDERSVSPSELNDIISITPNHSFLRIYNDVFDYNSHILKIDGVWYFWHDVENELQSWNWTTGVENIINELDLDDLSRLNNGWTIYDDGEHCINAQFSINQLANKRMT
jgi:hypothetical protein